MAQTQTSTHARDALPGDLPALTEIKGAGSQAVHTDRLRDAAQGDLRYMVLEAGGRVVGFALLVFRRPPHWSDTADTSRLPQIVDLQIHPNLRGRGYGSIFLEQIERAAAAAGASALYLSVDPVENPRACALYLRLGYQPLQEQPYRSAWQFVDSAGQQHSGEEWTVDMKKDINHD